MSMKKKPPPRPPLPQGPSVTPTKLQVVPKRSISIRYNPSTIEIDSDEEISIVRESKLTSQSSAEELEKIQSSDNLPREENASTRVCQPEETKTSPNPDLNGQTSSSFKKFFFSKTSSKSTPVSKTPDKTEDNVETRNKTSSWTGKTRSLTSSETTPNDEFEHVDLCCDPIAGGGEENTANASSGSLKTSSPPLLTVGSASQSNSRSSSPVFDSSPRAISPQIFRSKMSFTALLASRYSPEPENLQEIEPEASSNESVNIPSFSLSPEESSYESSFSVVKPIPVKATSPVVSETPDIPYMFLWICTMFFYTYYISNVPSFINGIVVGAELMYLIGCLFLWIFSPEESLQLKFEKEMQEYEERKRLSLAPKVDYSSKDDSLLQCPGQLKGWMYKCEDYESDAEKSSSDLTLVHVLLSENSLTISHPSTQVEQKVRLQFNTTKDYTDLDFVQEDKYSLENCTITLHPPDLGVKKVWSRKFPIHVAAKIVSSTDDWHELNIDGEICEGINGSEPLSPTSSTTSNKSKGENDPFLDEKQEFFLFARSGREKEEWYNRLKQAIKGDLTGHSAPTHDYPQYMAKLIPDSSNSSQLHSQVAWVNVLFGRIFWDVWQDDYWTNKLKQRIQTKLGKLKLPYFIRYLKITDLNLGQSFPAITKAYPPTLNERGTWVDLDVTYSGAFILTLETSVNVEYYRTLVTDMGKEGSNVEDDCGLVEFNRVSTSDDSDSARSTIDELEYWDSDHESESNSHLNTTVSTSPVKTSSSRVFPQSAKGKKILGMVERFAKNKWVQKAAETKFIQKAAEKFSNMPITLTVKVQRIKGTLTLNIPPPPTDRLWYGFRETPMLFVSARPKLGERQIKLTQVTDWIEKKLKQEFKGMFVLPHMEDLTIRLMNSGLEEELLLHGMK